MDNSDRREAKLSLAGLVPFVVGSLLPIASVKLARYLLTNTENGGSLPAEEEAAPTSNAPRKLVILYGTVTGTASEMATALYEDLLHIETLEVSIWNVKEFNEEEFPKQDIVIFLCCTWTDGEPPEPAVGFMTWLVDLAQDFRVSKDLYSNITFTGFGLGSKVYGGKKFCKPVRFFV
jgi:sulfite reductase alpha subunit-like flavoprotein